MKIGKKNVVSPDPLNYNIGLIGEGGIGKEQPVTEPILTENGWVQMGDIEIGDRVYGEDGNLYNVVGVYPQGIKDVYKVTFSDDTSTRCGADHLWHVITAKQRENNRKYNDNRHMVLPLKDIAKDYFRGGDLGYKYSVPIPKPIKFNKKTDLLIDPYLLGLLLGDGGFTTSCITFTNSEEDIYDEFVKLIDKYGVESHRREFNNHYQATIVNKNSSEYTNVFKDLLYEYGLVGCGSREKFIPEDYKLSSIEDRANLLSGIINTDGHINKSRITICTMSRQLANDILEIARSIGFLATIHEYNRLDKKIPDKYDNNIEYRISIMGNDFSLLKLSNKHKQALRPKVINCVKTIRNIELIGQEESQCIMTDNPNHLYITKDFIVTHNTTIVKQFCEKSLSNLDDPAEGYLFMEVGREDGADAISGINYVTVPKWSQPYDEDSNTIGFKTLVEDIVENKDSDYPNLRVVVVDTYDELRRLAEQEVIRQHNIANPQKKIKSINAAFGGFGKGEKMADDITLEYLWQLKSVGVHFIIIGHTKMRNAEDIMSEEKYTQLTTDMPLGSFNKIKTKLHFLGVAYKDRTFKDGKEGTKKISSETRKINFRDDNYSVDSKSRFADIEDEIDFDVDELIRVIKEAIQKEIEKDGKTAEQREKDQKAKEEAIENSEKKAKKEAKENKVDEEGNKKIIDEMMAYGQGVPDNEKDTLKEKITKAKDEFDFSTFKELVERPTSEVLKIKDLILA